MQTPKPITTWSRVFSRAKRQLREILLGYHWFIVMFTFVMVSLVIALDLVLRQSTETTLVY